MSSRQFLWVNINLFIKRLTYLIFFSSGASGVARLFHEGVLKKMAQANERPIIFALYDKNRFCFYINFICLDQIQRVELNVQLKKHIEKLM